MPIKDFGKIAADKLEDGNFEKIDTDNLALCNFRVAQRDMDKLKKYFHTKGLKLSQGIRMIVREYINDNGL